MKKLKIITSLCISALLLSACGNLGNGGTTPSVGSNKATKGYQTTGENNSNDYQGVIQDGHYKTSRSRGMGLIQNSDNLLNLKSFESGLTTISKEQFSTKQYVFQEGQILSRGTINNWLGRKSKKNPEGLNPSDNGKKGENERNPRYIQQIEEQDYMKQTNGKLQLAGMTIGIGMNKKDYYQKEKYGATFETEISKETRVAEGKKAAQKVLQRVRSKVGNNIPIVIAMFEQSPKDSLVGGSFYAYTVSKSGTDIGTWNETNIKSYVFPATEDNAVPNDNDETSFENFQKQVRNFFPNISNVTGQGQYKDKELQGMSVTITTQFYSQTEITSFTQFVAQAAKSYLPGGIPLDIRINGSNGETQAFVSTNGSKGSGYYTHVFSSY